MKKCFRLFWALACLPSALFSQDITGIWRGHFRENTPPGYVSTVDDRYRIEVQIAQQKTAFEAVTYSYLNNSFYGKASANGTVNRGSKKVLLRELKLVELRMLTGGACMMTYFLQYSQLNDQEYLSGNYTSVSANDSNKACGKGTVFLRRVTSSDFYKEPFVEKKEEELAAARAKHPAASAKKDIASVPAAKPGPNKAPLKKPATGVSKPPAKTSLASAPKTGTPGKTGIAKKTVKPPAPSAKTSSVTMAPEQRHRGSDSVMSTSKTNFPKLVPAVISTRSNEVVKTLTVNNENIQLALYDDGTVDNDTVSVYLDNRLVIAHARISDAPVNLTIKIDPEGTHELVMVADNLGDFPPNTSLLVIRDGEKKYEVRIVSTEQKNAVIRFSYQKP